MRSVNLLRLSGLIGTLLLFNDVSKDITFITIWTYVVIYDLAINKKVDSDGTNI